MPVLSDGSRHRHEVVELCEMRFENRGCAVDATVLPGDAKILLGANPMEDIALVILNPAVQTTKHTKVTKEQKFEP